MKKQEKPMIERRISTKDKHERERLIESIEGHVALRDFLGTNPQEALCNLETLKEQLRRLEQKYNSWELNVDHTGDEIPF